MHCDFCAPHPCDCDDFENPDKFHEFPPGPFSGDPPHQIGGNLREGRTAVLPSKPNRSQDNVK